MRPSVGSPRARRGGLGVAARGLPRVGYAALFGFGGRRRGSRPDARRRVHRSTTLFRATKDYASTLHERPSYTVRLPCKGRIAIFGHRPIWIKGSHIGCSAPLAACSLARLKPSARRRFLHFTHGTPRLLLSRFVKVLVFFLFLTHRRIFVNANSYRKFIIRFTFRIVFIVFFITISVVFAILQSLLGSVIFDSLFFILCLCL